jgi:hypothetical protein
VWPFKLIVTQVGGGGGVDWVSSTHKIKIVSFPVSAGMVFLFLLINNQIIIYNNLTDQYNNNMQMEYSLTRLSSFQASAWNPLYQKKHKIVGASFARW